MRNQKLARNLLISNIYADYEPNGKSALTSTDYARLATDPKIVRAKIFTLVAAVQHSNKALIMPG